MDGRGRVRQRDGEGGPGSHWQVAERSKAKRIRCMESASTGPGIWGFHRKENEECFECKKPPHAKYCHLTNAFQWENDEIMILVAKIRASVRNSKEGLSM